MAVIHVGSTSANSVGTTLDVSIPAGVAAGDLLIAFISQQNTGTIIAPAGWSEVAHAADAAQDSFAYLRVATGGDTAPQWTRSTAGKWTGHISAYRGAATTTKGLATLDSPSSANSWAMPAVSYSGSSSEAWRVDFLGQRSSTAATSWSVPAGMVSRSQQFTTGSGATYSVVADSNGSSVGSSPIQGLTYSNNGVASSAAAFISLVIGAPAMAENYKLAVWDGTAEVPLTLAVWDGTAEVPVSFTAS